MKIQNKKAFTLVELIIVITILAILATIGFMSYQSYTGDARDTNRIATVKQMSNGLDIAFTQKTVYPMPDGTVSTGSISGIDYAFKGIIGDRISQLIKMDKSVDPTSKAEYAYGVNLDRTQYQIGFVLENTALKTNPIIDSTYAAGGESAKVTGNYRGVIKFSTGGSSYIANIPSLVWSNTGAVNLMSSGTYYVVNKRTNLPYRLSATSTLGNKSPDTILKEMTGTGVATLTGVNISTLTKDNFDNIFSGALLASFNVQGASLSDNNVLKESVKSVILGTAATTTTTSGVTGTCTGTVAVGTYYGGASSYSITNGLTLTASGVTGTPTQNTCEFTCPSGYTFNGTSCTITRNSITSTVLRSDGGGGGVLFAKCPTNTYISAMTAYYYMRNSWNWNWPVMHNFDLWASTNARVTQQAGTNDYSWGTARSNYWSQGYSSWKKIGGLTNTNKNAVAVSYDVGSYGGNNRTTPGSAGYNINVILRTPQDMSYDTHTTGILGGSIGYTTSWNWTTADYVRMDLTCISK